MPAYPPEGVAMMFIGCEGSKADKVTMDFISSLNTNRVRNAALFSCSPRRDNVAIEEMRQALEARGVRVLKGSMAFPGKGFRAESAPARRISRPRANYARECLNSVSR